MTALEADGGMAAEADPYLPYAPAKEPPPFERRIPRIVIRVNRPSKWKIFRRRLARGIAIALLLATLGGLSWLWYQEFFLVDDGATPAPPAAQPVG